MPVLIRSVSSNKWIETQHQQGHCTSPEGWKMPICEDPTPQQQSWWRNRAVTIHFVTQAMFIQNII